MPIHLKVDICDAIDSFGDYEKLLEELSLLTPIDAIDVNLNTPGGRCDVGFLIIDALMGCKRAKLNMIVGYPTYSMGAIMAVCGDSLTIKPGSYIMFHDYSGGAHGKGDDAMQYVTNYREVFKARFIDICTPFLTRRECQSMFNGKDIYIRHDDPTLSKRIERHFKGR
jgi:ATP-dependent protease ClpP protease subunit